MAAVHHKPVLSHPCCRLHPCRFAEQAGPTRPCSQNAPLLPCNTSLPHPTIYTEWCSAALPRLSHCSAAAGSCRTSPYLWIASLPFCSAGRSHPTVYTECPVAGSATQSCLTRPKEWCSAAAGSCPTTPYLQIACLPSCSAGRSHLTVSTECPMAALQHAHPTLPTECPLASLKREPISSHPTHRMVQRCGRILSHYTSSADCIPAILQWPMTALRR